MKHLLSSTLALAALVMLGACSSDDDIATATGGVTNNNENVPVAFQNYVGRDITTRGTIQDISTVATNGFGVFAYNTVDPTTTHTTANNDVDGYESTAFENFSDNFMSNVKVSGGTANSATWTYSPLKYWPQSQLERISFLAYAPWSDGTSTFKAVTPTLVAKDGTSTGDLTFIKYTVDTDPANHVDLMWNTTDALNQYLYLKATGDGYEKSDNFNSTLTTAYRQNMKFSHATARVAFVVTSGVLSSKLNFEAEKDETSGVDATELEDNTKWTKNTETNSSAASDAQLTVKKAILMGKPSSAQVNGTPISGDIEGAFTKSGLLNLKQSSNSTTINSKKLYTPDWQSKSSEEVSVTFDASAIDQKVFVDGTIGTFADADGSASGTGTRKDPKGNTLSGVKAWNPTDGSFNNVIKGSTTVTTTTYTNVADNTKKLTKVEVSTSDNSANYIGTKSTDYLFVIPEDFSSTNDLYAYMEYELVYTDWKNDPEGYALTHKQDGSDLTAATVKTWSSEPTTGITANPKKYYSYGQIKKNLQGGHAYVIVANIGGQDGKTTPDVDPSNPTSFNPIQFTVEEVTSWGDEEDPDASL